MTAKKSTGDEDLAILMSISTSLMSIHRGYRAAVDRAVSHIGVSLAQATPLVTIGRVGGRTRPGVLADLLGIASPSLVRTLDQLEAAGLVERYDDDVDRRAKTVHLTRAGNAARLRIETALQELRTTLFEGVDMDDAQACLRVLRMLEARLGRPALEIVDMPTMKARRR